PLPRGPAPPPCSNDTCNDGVRRERAGAAGAEANKPAVAPGGRGTAEWTGTRLRELLLEAGVKDEAGEILFTGLDRGVQGDEVQEYQRSLTLDEAMREEVLLIYEMNGQPLEPQHGYPLRLVVPGWYGMTSVRWLARIEAIRGPFEGYQMMGSYRYSNNADDAGEPVTLQKVRSLMVP